MGGVDDAALVGVSGDVEAGLEAAEREAELAGQLPADPPRAPGLYDGDDVRAFWRSLRNAEKNVEEQEQVRYWIRAKEAGYSDWPPNTRVFALDKKKWGPIEARARFEELQAKQGLKLWDRPFETARYWCWRVYT